MHVKMIQTCDPERYVEMMALTSRTVRSFCESHGLEYEDFVGYKRGFHPWHATFNRIALFQEALRSGSVDWIIYIDADAFIVNQGFDIKSYLSDKDAYSIIARPVRPETVPTHDVNAGVMFLNCGHPATVWLVKRWGEMFNDISDEALHEARNFHDVKDDQVMLHDIIREDIGFLNNMYFESPDLINSTHASFIRQILRSNASSFEERLELIRIQTDSIMQTL